MTTEGIEALLTGLFAHGVAVTVEGHDIKVRGPSAAITDDDVAALRDSKPGIIRLLRLTEGLPIDDEAARLLAMEEVDPAEVPTCSLCGFLCNCQTLDDEWHCTNCEREPPTRTSCIVSVPVQASKPSCKTAVSLC